MQACWGGNRWRNLEARQQTPDYILPSKRLSPFIFINIVGVACIFNSPQARFPPAQQRQNPFVFSPLIFQPFLPSMRNTFYYLEHRGLAGRALRRPGQSRHFRKRRFRAENKNLGPDPLRAPEGPGRTLIIPSNVGLVKPKTRLDCKIASLDKIASEKV